MSLDKFGASCPEEKKSLSMHKVVGKMLLKMLYVTLTLGYNKYVVDCDKLKMQCANGIMKLI